MSQRVQADIRSDASQIPLPESLRFLGTRRSVPITMLGGPGPKRDELRHMLTVAARAPDHGGLEPWRFIIIEGDARQRAGECLAPVFLAENTAMEPEKREKFAGVIARVFTQTPLTIIVVSRADSAARIPTWEQELSTGAVCMNLLHAAHALGFAGSWLTGWAAYSDGARRVLGIADGEKIAGIIPIGTAKELPTDRKRPNVDTLVTRWRAQALQST